MFFKKKLKYESNSGKIDGDILMVNPYINIISSACAECYKVNNEKKTYDEQAEYISRRIATGHESILEHSNIVMLITLTDKAIMDLSEFLQYCKFLNVKIRKNKKIYLLIGGSLRGYKHITRNIENPNNPIYKCMMHQLYHLNKNIFKDFIEDGIMAEEMFKNDIQTNELNKAHLINGNIDMINIDNNETLLEKIEKYGFKEQDTYDMCTVTVHFTRMPRVISQQLTRHRNAITQASQRYINYSNACFITPEECKPERYDKTKLYNVKVFGTESKITMQELGNEIVSIYPQLIEQDLLKEDARAFLPNNVETSLFVTFTYTNLFHFLDLRMDKAAQADIRKCANEIYGIFNHETLYTLEDMRNAILPYYKSEENRDAYSEIDEPVK